MWIKKRNQKTLTKGTVFQKIFKQNLTFIQKKGALVNQPPRGDSFTAKHVKMPVREIRVLRIHFILSCTLLFFFGGLSVLFPISTPPLPFRTSTSTLVMYLNTFSELYFIIHWLSTEHEKHFSNPLLRWKEVKKSLWSP